ncbi:P68 family surface lipoprotein [Candidatus Mycoplasma pogonae]
MNLKWRNILTKSAIAALPLASMALVACNNVDYTQDKKMVFASTTTSTKEALKTIIKKYNEEHKEKTGLTWEIQDIPNGYRGAADLLNKSLPVGDTDSLFNLTLNYPSLLAILQKYKYELAFPKDKVDLEKYFSPNFLEGNNNIAGGENGTQWAVPMFRSTEMLAINGALFGFIVDNAVTSDGAKLKDTEKDFWNKLIAASKSDKEFVSKILGTYNSTTEGLKNYEFKLEDLQTYDGLVNLSLRIHKAYPNFLAKKEGLGDKGRGKAVLGIDALAGAFYTSSFASVNADYKKWLFSKGANNLLNYRSLLWDPESEQAKLMKDTYEVFSPLLKEGILYVKEGGAYTSNHAKKHQVIFTIGSTAGYSKSFFESDKSKDMATVKLPGDKVVDLEIESIAWYINKPVEKDLKDLTEEQKNNVIATAKSGKHTNYIYKFGYSGAFKNKKYDFVADSKETEDAILASLNTPNTTNFGIVAEKIDDLGDNFKLTLSSEKNKSKNFVFIPRDKFEITVFSSSELLNENEFFVINPPQKTKASNEFNVQMLQGPSLIALNAGEEENEETFKFTKWFLEQKRDWQWEDRNKKKIEYKNLTAAELYAKVGNYILPTAENIAASKGKKQTNPALDMTLNVLENVQSGAVKPFEDPVDSKSGKFREVLDTTFHTMTNKKADEKTYETFIEDFTRTLGTTFR